MIAQFITDSGIVVPAISTAQMREVDRIAIEETGPNLFQMMENAGRNLALSAMEMLGNRGRDASVVVLAGTGGNGGGGICAARHLANHGITVRLCITDPDRLDVVPALQRGIFLSTPGTEVGPTALGQAPVDLILDALIGYSLHSAPRGIARDLILWANDRDVAILSLDVPSGVNSTSGDVPGEHVAATQTMTLALPKSGLLPHRTGALVLADIGIPSGVYKRLSLSYRTPFDHRYRVPLKVFSPPPGHKQ